MGGAHNFTHAQMIAYLKDLYVTGLNTKDVKVISPWYWMRKPMYLPTMQPLGFSVYQPKVPDQSLPTGGPDQGRHAVQL